MHLCCFKSPVIVGIVGRELEIVKIVIEAQQQLDNTSDHSQTYNLVSDTNGWNKIKGY